MFCRNNLSVGVHEYVSIVQVLLYTPKLLLIEACPSLALHHKKQLLQMQVMLYKIIICNFNCREDFLVSICH